MSNKYCPKYKYSVMAKRNTTTSGRSLGSGDDVSPLWFEKRGIPCPATRVGRMAAYNKVMTWIFTNKRKAISFAKKLYKDQQSKSIKVILYNVKNAGEAIASFDRA